MDDMIVWWFMKKGVLMRKGNHQMIVDDGTGTILVDFSRILTLNKPSIVQMIKSLKPGKQIYNSTLLFEGDYVSVAGRLHNRNIIATHIIPCSDNPNEEIVWWSTVLTVHNKTSACVYLLALCFFVLRIR